MNGPGSAILAEYGLTTYTYNLLRCCVGPVVWSDLKQRYGAPQSARGLVERGLLAGPAAGDNINSRPFALTSYGHSTLSKIERGLHRYTWLSAGRLKVLEILAAGYQPDRALLDAGCHRMSIISLHDAGYIEYAGDVWHITCLGQDALDEWRAAEAARTYRLMGA